VISFTKSEDSKKPDKVENKAKKQKVRQLLGKEADDRSGMSVLPRRQCQSHRNCHLVRGVERWSPKARWPGARPVLSRSILVSQGARATLMSVCYGIAPQDMGPNWECDLCANTHLEEAHSVSHTIETVADDSTHAAYYVLKTPRSFPSKPRRDHLPTLTFCRV
jgi:hypothetical protein